MHSKRLRYSFVFGVVFFLLVFQAAFLKPPMDFPSSSFITIKSGTSITSASRTLEEEGYIRSSALFGVLARTFGNERGVLSGTYHFEKPTSAFFVVSRLLRGDFGNALVRVTIPEGSTVREMATILEETFPEFDGEVFKHRARQYEGYLFPDTYLFAAGVEPDTVIDAMRTTFDEKLVSIQDDIDLFEEPLEDIVIMASILEKEARQYETMRMVADILWKRLDIGMALQVDAVFGFILETETFSPTFEQLEIDSPYNTYLYPGLPPGPISNPGIDALRAAVNPKKNPYLYYLTGKDGTMHYAETFNEHVANRKYLR